jgi:D-alanyl-D-alanine dipeptidase
MHARSADVHGEQLRFEPLPHKNTLGYWTNRNDWASFEFEVARPGTFEVELLAGCGRGSGGSAVELTIGSEKVSFAVDETGGFQEFRTKIAGRVTLEKAGRYRLDIRAMTKPGPAVMDLRQIRLLPAN